jgi:hypothetical protein
MPRSHTPAWEREKKSNAARVIHSFRIDGLSPFGFVEFPFRHYIKWQNSLTLGTLAHFSSL